MNSGVYLKCIQSEDFNINNVVGLYDFNSGDSYVVYNLLHPTGESYVSALVNSKTKPLVPLDESVISGNFSGANCYRVGYKNELAEWSMLIDLQNGRYCDSGFSHHKMFVVNTFQNYTGFGIYITESHNLAAVISTNNVNIPSIYTLNKELPQECIIYVGYDSGNVLDFGYFDLDTEKTIIKSIDISAIQIHSDPIYLGGYNNQLSYGGISFGGTVGGVLGGDNFSGKLYKAALFSNTLLGDESNSCANCLFATGIKTVSNNVVVSFGTITGYSYSLVSEIQVTGTGIGQANIYDNNGDIVTYYIESGITGNAVIRDELTPLTGIPTLISTGVNTNIPIYDTDAKLARLSYNIDFSMLLESGDNVVVYTYDQINNNINHLVNNLTVEYKNGLQYQLWGNGLLETKDVDYEVDVDRITGFDSTDRLLSDYTTQQSIIIDYSGWWNRSKIWINSGSGGTKKYYPTTGMFPEGVSGEIYITGINNIPIHAGYDLYLDGQRLVSGISYSTGLYLGAPAIILSGSGMPDFIADVTYSGNGNVSGISNINSAELIFYPVENNPNYYCFDITGGNEYVTGINGYNPQVWVNGVRSYMGQEFVRSFKCALNTGFNDEYGDIDFLVFNNEDDIFGLT